MDKASQSSFIVIAFFSLLLLLLMSAVIDTSTKKIPNPIVLTIIIIGLCFNSLTFEGIGLWGSIIGFSVGLIIMLPSYSFAGMGAGDVKLMAAIGSVVGFDKILNVVLYSYLIIFVMSLLFIILKGDLTKLLVRYKAFFYELYLIKSHIVQKLQDNDYLWHLPFCWQPVTLSIQHFANQNL